VSASTCPTSSAKPRSRRPIRGRPADSATSAIDPKRTLGAISCRLPTREWSLTRQRIERAVI
jgi:hypothetical protein